MSLKKHDIQYDRENFLYKRVAALSSSDFVQKFNNRLLFSTFICRLVKITNIISMIRQQVPENDVKKITSQDGET